MIFSTTAFAGAGVFCFFTGCCFKNCCISGRNSQVYNSDCCFGMCPRVFEDPVPEEDLRIPTSRSSLFDSSVTLNSYASLDIRSVEDLEMARIGYEALSEDEDEDVKNRVTGGVANHELDLITDSPSEVELNPTSPMSPPDLFFLDGPKVVAVYSDFVNKIVRTAQGPPLIDADEIKSKKSSPYVPGNDDYDAEDMDAYDENYSRKLSEYSSKHNVPIPRQEMKRSGSSDKSVAFNSKKDVLEFLSDPVES